VDAGHQVTAVSRSPEKGRLLSGLGASPVGVDLFDPQAVDAAVRGHDVIFNLATAIPRGADAAKESAWLTNHRIRREASANLVRASRTAGVQRFIQESITLLYADGGEALLREDAPIEATWVTASAAEAERNVRVLDAGETVAIVLRFASFYGPDSHHTLDMIGAARNGEAWAMGAESAYSSSIMIDDAAAAAVAALDAPPGVFNISDDKPVRRGEFFEVLGDAVGRRLRYPPASAGQLADPKLDMMLRSHRVSNERFRRTTGWRPRYVGVRDGWPAVIAEAAVNEPERVTLA
jgi:nucleoside-diphosphate-sugar epimerase